MTIEKREHLGVSQRSASRSALPQTLNLKAPDLVDEPEVPHPVHAVGDALIKVGPGQCEAKLNHWVDRVVLGQCCAERAAGQLDDFQRPDDPATVARQD